MWRYFKWGFWIFVILVVGGFLHYTLPHRDTVRITGTYNRLTTVGENSIFYASPDAGTGETSTRDIRFIEAVRPNGRVIVYRNEDTGWVWPPYFKYDSANLQAEASNLQSTANAPVWVSMTHYGWRIAWMSIYPNAVRVRVVAGPDASVFPWVNIVILSVLAFLLFMVRRIWLQFRERTLDPAFENVGDAFGRMDDRSDAARTRARTSWGRFRAWLTSLFRR